MSARLCSTDRSRPPCSMLIGVLAVVALLAGWSADDAVEPREITFASGDDLIITADLYDGGASDVFIVLFHQAGWSRGEYREIAPVLNELGYDCMAVDLRSGNEVNGVRNQTNLLAEADDRDTGYADALQDVVAALQFAQKKHGEGKVLAWGSSYSASLVLKAAGDDPNLVDGVLAFAPGEYFRREGKSKTWIADAAASITVPVFITSARREQEAWQPIYEAIGTTKKTAFVPETPGNHGSRALWSKFPDSDAYWAAVRGFLAEHFRG